MQSQIQRTQSRFRLTIRRCYQTAWAASVCLLLTTQSALSQQPSVLDLPSIIRQQAIDSSRGIQELRAGKYDHAESIFLSNLKRVPHDAASLYNLACAQSLNGKSSDALSSLRLAVKHGYRGRAHIAQDPDLESIRSLKGYAQLLEDASSPKLSEDVGWRYESTPAQVADNAVLIEAKNISLDSRTLLLQAFVDFPGNQTERESIQWPNPNAKLLNEWLTAKTAAGNQGDLYDNHDRQHSALQREWFPGLTYIKYGSDVQARQMDNGPQAYFQFWLSKKGVEANSTAESPLKVDSSHPREDGSGLGLVSESTEGQARRIDRTIVLGNSSTAMTGSVMWRSMPRYLLTSPGGPEVLVQHYLNNHVYVYPEHRDHDTGHDDSAGWGDVFHANTPYYVVSQGSSGSDQAFVQALAATLAAIQPDVKSLLSRRGLIAPTMQMIIRRCYATTLTDQDYLNGRAHPTVFDGSKIDVMRMLKMAHEMTQDDIPPIVTLQVIAEDVSNPTVDYFDGLPSEAVLTTPFAIARVCHSTKFWRTMTVKATGVDVNHRPVKLHWVLLRGEAKLARIEPVDGSDNVCKFVVGYHARRPIEPGAALESNRVDFAVVGHNGVHFSAPSFVSFYFPDNERRQYDEEGRIRSVDYSSASSNYADPILVPLRDWRDEYHYDQVTGDLMGWKRYRANMPVESFDAVGRVQVRDDTKQIGAYRELFYERTRMPDGRTTIKSRLASEK